MPAPAPCAHGPSMLEGVVAGDSEGGHAGKRQAGRRRCCRQIRHARQSGPSAPQRGQLPPARNVGRPCITDSTAGGRLPGQPARRAGGGAGEPNLPRRAAQHASGRPGIAADRRSAELVDGHTGPAPNRSPASAPRREPDRHSRSRAERLGERSTSCPASRTVTLKIDVPRGSPPDRARRDRSAGSHRRSPGEIYPPHPGHG
jgi:hypothetical protein